MVMVPFMFPMLALCLDHPIKNLLKVLMSCPHSGFGELFCACVSGYRTSFPKLLLAVPHLPALFLPEKHMSREFFTGCLGSGSPYLLIATSG